MSLRSVFVGSLRGVLIALATGGAALGLLAVFHPFAPLPLSASLAIPSGSNAAEVLQQKIDTARDTLRRTEAALDAAKPTSLSVSSTAPTGAELDAQIAAATERRDLALRHAQAIRDAIKSGADLGSLAEIRDSVVVGQLLGQEAALDAQIAEQGARFKPTHPVMRALLAQKTALLDQIKAEAAGIATALESEARLDDAQVKLLQSNGGGISSPASSIPADTTTLVTQREVEQTQLDQLLDAYFSLKPGSNSDVIAASDSSTLSSPLNLFVIAVAFVAALVMQIGLGLRRRRLHREALDMALWTADSDPERAPEPVVVVHPRQSVLRKAS